MMPPIKLEEQSHGLLILPPLPSPLKRASLWSAYKATFERLLPQAVPQNKECVSRLDVAIVLPAHRLKAARTAHYPGDQLIFQEIYTLVCLAAARANVELDFPGGVDVRVLLLDPNRPDSNTVNAGQQWLSGPVIDINTFAASSRSYSAIYGVEGEAGEVALQAVLNEMRNKHKTIPSLSRLPSGPSMSTTSSTRVSDVDEKEVKIHHNVINGGTFDHLHLGHKLLLTATVYLSDPTPLPTASTNTTNHTRSITFGITGDELLVNKKHPEQLESWDTRQQRTHEFVSSILAFHPATLSSSTTKLDIQEEHINKPGPNGKIVRVTYSLKDNTSTTTTTAQPTEHNQQVILNYTQIADPYGPTITVQDLTAIVVSAETRAGGQAVNTKRLEKGWSPLQVFEVGVLDATVNEEESEEQQQEEVKEDFDGKLSSTGMRKRLAELEKEGSGGKNGGKL